MIRLGILGSTRGTNMLALIQAIEDSILLATIEIVISNKPNALILERAKTSGLSAQYISPEGLNRSEYDKKISDLLVKHHVDLVVLIGYMRILSPDFVSFWSNKVINVHPSLLPAFAGKMDVQVHQAVLDVGMKESGCTIHYVTHHIDAGPIILQRKCRVSPDDTVESLKEKVQKLEGLALVQSIQLIKVNGHL